MDPCSAVRIPGCGPVARLGLGTWATFGDGVDFVSARQIVFRALDRGLNYIDTAASYANGVPEDWLGRFLTAADRDHIVVSTKVFHVQNAELGPSIGGLGRKAIFQSVEASLRRLRTERLDLLYCHRPDPFTPIEETLGVLADLIRQGKVGAWGVSRWSPNLLQQANILGDSMGIGAPAAVQEPWNLLLPNAVEAIRSVLKPETKLVGYSILAGGVLTGKYLEGVPSTSRLAVSREAGKGWSANAAQLNAIRTLVAAAHQQGIAASTLVAIHALRSGVCDILLTGASRVEQFDNLADALHLAQDEAIAADLEDFGFGTPGTDSD